MSQPDNTPEPSLNDFLNGVDSANSGSPGTTGSSVPPRVKVKRSGFYEKAFVPLLLCLVAGGIFAFRVGLKTAKKESRRSEEQRQIELRQKQRDQMQDHAAAEAKRAVEKLKLPSSNESKVNESPRNDSTP